jgi:hypothetical protein
MGKGGCVKAALIPPIPDLDAFGNGDFHLLLSHLLKENAYYRHYFNQRKRGAYLVLDNSAHEKGEGEDPEALIYNALSIDAQEVVVPDALDDGPRTVELAIQSIEAWFENSPITRQGTVLARFPALMYVPQGKDVREWRECLHELVLIHKFISHRWGYRRDLVIGLSKDYEKWEGGLMGLISDYLVPCRQSLSNTGVKMHVHLLGWGRDLWMLRTIAQAHPWIRSTDSAKPFVYARKRISLDPREPAPPYPGRPVDYFTKKLSKAQHNAAAVNCMVFQTTAAGG